MSILPSAAAAAFALFSALCFGAGLTVSGQANACVPGCSGYHLVFTGPPAVSSAAPAAGEEAVTVTWADPTDGPSATFDLLASSTPVPVYPMHAFPAQLPGQALALGLSASPGGSYRWATAGVLSGSYFLYAVFHNPPFDTLVMPFAAVAVTHGAATSPALALVQTPRGQLAGSGSQAVNLAVSAGEPGATYELWVGSPPLAEDGSLVAGPQPISTAGAGLGGCTPKTVSWETGGAAGAKIFKAVVRAANGQVLATALSPGQIELGPATAAAAAAPSGCGSAAGEVPGLGMALALACWLRRTTKPISEG